MKIIHRGPFLYSCIPHLLSGMSGAHRDQGPSDPVSHHFLFQSPSLPLPEHIYPGDIQVPQYNNANSALVLKIFYGSKVYYSDKQTLLFISKAQLSFSVTQRLIHSMRSEFDHIGRCKD